MARNVEVPTVSIEGTTFTEASASTSHNMHPAGGFRPTLSAVPYTFSVYLKAGTRRYVQICPDTLAGNYAVLNIDTQTWTIVHAAVFGTYVYHSSSIQDVGNGWYRASLTITATAASTIFYIAGIVTTTSGRSESYLGNGSTIICWGAQLETGSVATSLIPTFAASATRVGDSVGFLLSTIPALGSEYSFYVQFSVPVAGSARYAITLHSVAGTDWVGIRDSGNTALIVQTPAGNQASLGGAVVVANVVHKDAVRIKLNDFAMSSNGGVVVTDTLGAMPAVTNVGGFGSAQAGGGALATFHIQQLVIVSRGWNDAELVMEATP